MSAVACGGGSSGSVSVAPNDVAVVGDTHITIDQLRRQIELLKKQEEIAGTKLPKVGTQAYTDQVVQPLVQRLVLNAQAAIIAQNMGITVSDADIKSAIDKIVKQSYGGDQSKLEADIKKYGYTDEDFKELLIRPNVIGQKIQAKLKTGLQPTAAAIKKYYDTHQSQFVTADTRKVQFVLTGSKADADAAHKALSAKGADWNTVAKKYAIPPGPPQTGGDFTATAGQVETNFGSAVFGDLKTGELSDLIPVSQSYMQSSLAGKCKPQCYFIVKPTADVVHGGKQSFDQAQSQIKSLLASQADSKVQAKIRKLVDDEKKVTHYNPAYAPSTAASSGSSSATT